MEKTVEKSTEQAKIIASIAMFLIPLFDEKYCRELAMDIKNQASTQEAMAALNPLHPQIKNDILRMKGVALEKLCDYVDTLKEIDKLTEEDERQEKTAGKIKNLFM